MATIPDVKNRWQYEDLRQRIDRATFAIEAEGGFLKAPKMWLFAYNVMCLKMLEYQIANDLIPELL